MTKNIINIYPRTFPPVPYLFYISSAEKPSFGSHVSVDNFFDFACHRQFVLVLWWIWKLLSALYSRVLLLCYLRHWWLDYYLAVRKARRRQCKIMRYRARTASKMLSWQYFPVGCWEYSRNLSTRWMPWSTTPGPSPSQDYHCPILALFGLRPLSSSTATFETSTSSDTSAVFIAPEEKNRSRERWRFGDGNI